MDTSKERFAGIALALLALFAVLGFTLPIALSTLLQATLIMAALGISFQIVFGLLGQLSLGHTALFGAGAYVYAYGSLHGVPTVVALAAACLTGGLAGVVVSAVTARLGGAYFAVVTLALASVIAVVVSANYALGHSEGLVGIPSLGIFDFAPRPLAQTIYTGICFLVILTAFYALWRSRLGWTLEAVRDNPALAAAVGINVPVATIVATGISGLFAGLVGGVFAQYARFVGPDVFGFYYIVTPLAAVTIGGSRLLLGSLLGCIVVVVIPNVLAVGPILNQVISGLLLAGFIILVPQGLGGLLAGRRKPAAVAAASSPPSIAALPKPTPGHERSGTVLKVEGVNVRYGALEAVKDFNLSIAAGEIVGLIGANGAGKSSLVNAISGLVRLSSGTVVVNGADLSQAAPHTRIRHGLSRTFQNTAVIDTLSVGQSVRLAEAKGRYLRFEADDGRADAVITACGLAALADVKVGALTYMHRRMAAIALALVTDPKLIMLDEATAGLTASERKQIGDVVVALARTRGTAFLVIEHDVEFVARIADRIVVMAEGKHLRTGAAAEVLNHPEVVASYLGSSWHAA